MDNGIIAETEHIDKTISAFAGRLEEYVTSMREELDAFTRSVSRLGDAWESDDYELFRDTMRAKTDKIRAELVKANDLKTYLDETAEQFRTVLALLREGAEK